MTDALDFDLDVSIDEREELQALIRALTWADGFKLIFARCDDDAKRRTSMEAIRHALPNRAVIERHFESPTANLLGDLESALLETPRPAFVSISGVSNAVGDFPTAWAARFVVSLNTARSGYVETVPCPLLIWCSGPMLAAIQRGAPDFFSIRSGVYDLSHPVSAARLAVGHIDTSLGERLRWQLTDDETATRLAVVSQLLAELERAGDTDMRLRGRFLTELGSLHQARREYAQAEEALRRALGLLDQGKERGTALTVLSAMLAELGRREEALTAAQEAVAVARILASTRPDAFRPDLAMSLNNLGNCLSKLGRHEEAMTPAREAVDLFRALASARPDAFRPGLAMSLNNLGNHLSELGRREEAQTPAREAVDIRRALARARPDAFRPDLAMSLGNLGNRLGELGRREEALTAAEEAVDLYRALARTRPDAFRPDLARSLGVLGYCMTALGQNVESAKAFHEGMSVLLPHLVKSPSVFGELARDLTDDYSDACDAAGIEPDAQLLAAMDAALEGAHGALQPSSIEHPASSSAPTPLTTP